MIKITVPFFIEKRGFEQITYTHIYVINLYLLNYMC